MKDRHNEFVGIVCLNDRESVVYLRRSKMLTKKVKEDIIYIRIPQIMLPLFGLKIKYTLYVEFL